MSKYFEVLVVGDTHGEALDNFLPPRKGGWWKVQLKMVQQAVNYCRARGIKHIIHLGDVFETPYPSQRSVSQFLRFLSKCTDLEWSIILGNHDYHNRSLNSLEVTKLISRIGIMKHVRVYTKTTQRKFNGVPVTFLPWPDKTPPKVSTGQVVVAHADVRGAKWDSGETVAEGIKPKKTKDIWLIGHIHRRQELGNYHFIGTPFQLGFLEESKKFFSHYTFAIENGRLEYTMRPVPVKAAYTLHNLLVQDFEKLEILPPPNYYRLVLAEGVQFPQNFLENNPNVIRYDSLGRKAKTGKVREASQISTFREEKSLKKFLTERQKFSPKQVRAALKVIAKVKRKLHVT